MPLDTNEALDQAVRAYLDTRPEHATVTEIDVGEFLGMPANGRTPERLEASTRLRASLDRVADRAPFGAWRPKPRPRPPEPTFSLEILNGLWSRCSLDKPFRPADVEREYSTRLPQARDALHLLQASGQVELRPGRKSSRYAVTDRTLSEYRAVDRTLAFVRSALGDGPLPGAAALAGLLTISADTAESLLRGLSRRAA